MKPLYIIIALFVLAACSRTYDVDRPDQVSTRLQTSASAYVSVPPDGWYGRTNYIGSGVMAAQIVKDAFARHLRHVEMATAPQTFEGAMEIARQMNATYLIAPSIVHWEDRATHWSGRSDTAILEISVVEVATGKIIERATVKATSGASALFVGHPQKLLPRPVKLYADSLFLSKPEAATAR